MSLTRRASALAIGGMVDYALQFLMPMVLVRQLSQADVGDYRLVWLITTAALPVFTLSLPQTLYYFLPGAAARQRVLVASNTLWFHLGMGVLFMLLALAMLATGSASGNLLVLGRHLPWPILFVSIWMATAVFDTLPNASGNAGAQARFVIVMAVLRALSFTATAYIWHSVGPLLITMTAFAIVKNLAGLHFLRGMHPHDGSRGLPLDWPLLRRQLRYGLPFGIASCLYILRLQADQWVVAARFSLEIFTLISFAAVVQTVQNLITQPVANAVLPLVRASVADNRHGEAASLLARAYSSSALILLPVLGLLYCTAQELVQIAYTNRYAGAAPLMKIYLAAQIAGTFGAGQLLTTLNRGAASLWINLLSLGFAVAVSITGVHFFGLVGAPLGSALAGAASESCALWIVASALGVSVPALVGWSISARAVAVVIAAVAACELLATYYVPAGVVTGLLYRAALYLAILSMLFEFARLRPVAIALIGNTLRRK